MSTGIVSRRVRPNPPGSREETAAEHIRNALAVLKTLLDAGTLSDEDREGVQAGIRRLWRALSLLERGDEE